MDPPSPIHRDLEHEAILENMIHDAPSVDPAESNGMEVDRSEHEADGSDDGEGDSSDDGEAGEPLTKSGEVDRKFFGDQ